MRKASRRRLLIAMLLLMLATMPVGLGIFLLSIRRDYNLYLASLHSREASNYQKVASAEIQDSVKVWALGEGHACRLVEMQISEEELREQQRMRTLAGRRASYHLALSEKYALAARRPWIAPAPDTPGPD
jgi:hypothetical protein